MNTLRATLPWLLRLSGLTLVVLGLLFWTGHALQLVQLHMLVGVLFTLAYFGIVVVAARGGLALGPSLFATLWGFVIPTFGMIQTAILPGPMHWVVRLAHLLVGMVAMGVADRLLKGGRGEARGAAGTAGAMSS
ncbi:MAG: hypothetical protein JF590_07560 [Gemmatimonadetes bacterium]|nr:hypothetical protein [Gemmatimonadota bacterium]